VGSGQAAEVNAVVWFIGQSMVIIAAAFLLGILVGWLIRGPRPKREPLAVAGAQVPAEAAEITAAAEPVPEPVTVAAAVPEPVAGAAEKTAAAEPDAVPPVAVAVLDEPQDLKRIEGIGPKMARALHDAGIRTYSQLAEADEATLRRAIKSHGLRFAPSIVTWSRQARLLADGDDEGFADLTRRLVAGRDTRRDEGRDAGRDKGRP
jgi:predicted flap endonuclease-1-like 5' DNA nuclease